MVQLIIIFSDYMESSSLFVNLGENFGWWDGFRDTCDDVTRHVSRAGDQVSPPYLARLCTRCDSDSDLVLVPPPTQLSTGDPGQGNIGGMWENSPGHFLAPGDR